MLRILSLMRAAVITPAAALVLTIGGTLVLEQWRLSRTRAQLAATALQLANAAAEQDSTRDAESTNRALATLLGDSVRLVERQVVQVTQRADALDRALGGERRAAYVLALQADSLHQVVLGDSTGRQVGDSAVRRATFHVRREPYTVRAAVSVPAPPDTGSLAIDIAVDPVRIEARVSCSAPDVAGVRRASIDATAPKWATVTFGAVQQAPEVCGTASNGSPSRSPPVEFRRLVVGGGLVRASDAWRSGVFVGLGIAIRF